MDVCARLRLPSGQVVEARPGDFVGRLPSAAIRLNDPRISEAHALVSLRARTLKLLALRGRFAVSGVPLQEVVLEAGTVIQLAPDLALTVLEVTLPTSVLGLEGDLVPRQVLGPVTSLRVGSGTPEVLPGFHPDADALLWSGGDGFLLRLRGEAERRVDVGDRFALPIPAGGATGSPGALGLRLVAVPLTSAEVDATQRDDLDQALTLVVRYDSVHVHRGKTVASIDGMPARVVTELAQIGVPVEWRTLARLLWPGEDDDAALRARFDRTMTRLRKRLVELGLRRDLVRTDGGGRFELLLGPDDRVRDET